jgi:leukotriene-A4 hydrolase
MENPITTFVTPSIVIGDKSAVNVVCHEIAHSWTGNLVTNSSWEDFWLNEGFTRYLESKIVQKIYGDSAFKFQLRESHITMRKIVEDGMKGGGSILWPELKPLQNPEDVLNSIQYEKGFYLLYQIEKVLGSEEKMFEFMREYIRAHDGGNTSTPLFLKFLESFFVKEFGGTEQFNELNMNEWLFNPGFPPKLHDEAF